MDSKESWVKEFIWIRWNKVNEQKFKIIQRLNKNVIYFSRINNKFKRVHGNFKDFNGLKRILGVQKIQMNHKNWSESQKL